MKRTALSEDVQRKIRHIEIYTRRLLSGALVGDTRSAIKGSGLDFDQIREYVQGDDVRFIDWNASARMDKLLVKQYTEERSRTVVLAVDISASRQFGDHEESKADLMAEIAGVLALVATYGNDHVALILFSDEVEQYIPPGRGRNHAHTILEAIFGAKPARSGTSVEHVLKRLAQLKRRDGVAFLISDFIDEHFQTYLPVVSNMYDLVALRCLSDYERAIPDVGFLTAQDLETGQEVLIDARTRKVKNISALLANRLESQNTLFKRYGIDVLDVSRREHCVGDIVRFFRRRMRY